MKRLKMKQTRHESEDKTPNHLTPLSLSNKKNQACPASEGPACVLSRPRSVSQVTHGYGGCS